MVADIHTACTKIHHRKTWQMVVYTTDQSKRQKIDSLSPPTINRGAMEPSPEPQCDLFFGSFETQQEKTADKDADGFFNCSKCPNKFDKKWKLSAHMRNVHGPRQPCLHVDCVHRTPFTTKGNLKIHTDQFHKQICRLPCLVESCEGNTKSFDGLFGCQDSLDRHTKRDHFELDRVPRLVESLD
jgi:DNA-directed RNA polymerase subunit M/transcription elongation factor TFIIS